MMGAAVGARRLDRGSKPGTGSGTGSGTGQAADFVSSLLEGVAGLDLEVAVDGGDGELAG